MTSTPFILKLNTIAALIICAACIVSRLTRKKYTCKWKYLVAACDRACFAGSVVPCSVFPGFGCRLYSRQRQTGDAAKVRDLQPQIKMPWPYRPYLSSDDTADTGS